MFKKLYYVKIFTRSRNKMSTEMQKKNVFVYFNILPSESQLKNK